MFDCLNYLLYEKNKSGLDSDLLQEFSPFLIRKTFSFYDSGKHSNYINDTLNQYSDLFQTVEEQFKFYDAIIPKLNRRKWEYIKKEPTKTKKVKILPINPPEFLSKREVDLYESLSK